jgi:amidase
VARLAVTRSVRDTAALVDAVAGPATGDPYWAPPPARPYAEEVGADPGSLRIGWIAEAPDGGTATDPEIAAAVERVAGTLAELGHRVEQAAPPALADPEMGGHFLTCFGVWTLRELDHIGELLGTPVTEAGVEAGTWAVAEMGRAITAPQYLAGVEGLHRTSRAVMAWWQEDGWDLLLTPTLPEVPPTLGQFVAAPDNPLAGVLRSTPMVSFTAAFNITGQPAVSLPLAWSEGGVPLGMQFVAAPAREDVLVRLAAQLEEALPWAERRP